MCHHALEQSVCTASHIAEDVHKVTPKYDHIITDAVLHKNLAKQHLHKWPSKKPLDERTITLAKAFASMSQFHAEFGLQPDLKTDPRFQERLASAQSVFASAKAAITVLAAVNILFGLSGDDQIAAAAGFVAKKRDALKAPLLQALEKVASTDTKREKKKV